MFNISKSKIKSIRRVNAGKTYDISVKNNHNFFCNDILIHNCDYIGPVKVILLNINKEPFQIEYGTRIAQMVLAKVKRIKWDTETPIVATERGTGGFGSTDKK